MTEAYSPRFNCSQLVVTEQFFDKNLMVLAPPGSGKTLTLVHRICNLISSHQVKSREILALTFTKKAEEELKSRLESILKIDLRGITVCTFHSLGRSIIEKYHTKLLMKPNPKVIEDKDKNRLVGSVLKDMIKEELLDLQDLKYDDFFYKFRMIHYMQNLDDLQTYFKEEIEELIDEVKNAKGNSEYYLAQSKNFKVFLECYNERLKKENSIDFEDMLILATKIFSENPDIIEVDSCIKKYILVDEFQDTSRSQFRLLNAITRDNTHVTVFGDDDQMIYNFCGVSENIFQDFEQKYMAKKVILEENYRSTSLIVESCAKLISFNNNRCEKSICTTNPQGVGVHYLDFINEEAECKFIANEILSLHKNQNIPYRNIAVLCRIKEKINSFTKMLAKFVPASSSIKGKPLDKHENFIISFIEFILDEQNEEALISLMNYKKTAIKIIHRSPLIEGNMYNLLRKNYHYYPEFRKLVNLVEKMKKCINRNVPYDFIKIIVAQFKIKVDGLLNCSKRITATGREGLIEFLNISREYKMKKSNYVTCSNIHCAKGKEWDVVFVIRSNDYVMPVIKNNKDNIEEERRVAYVAMSRSKRFLYVTWINCCEGKDMVKSRFVNEMKGNMSSLSLQD